MDIFARKLRKNKSASLELSINAIVILVIAMVLLGLGLAFVRGLFEKGSRNLGGVLDNTRLENPASYDQPLTVDKTITVRKDDSVSFHVGYYNTGGTKVVASPAGRQPINPAPVTTLESVTGTTVIGCYDKAGVVNFFRLASPPAFVASNSAVGYEVILTPLTVSGGAYTTAQSVWQAPNPPTVPFTPVPPGSYICPLSMWVQDTTKALGTPGPSLSTQVTVVVQG